MLKGLFSKIYPYLIMALLCLALWNTQRLNVKYKNKASDLESTVDNLNQEIKKTKIRLNDSIEVYQAEVKTLKMTQQNIQSRYESLLKASKLKPKDVGNITEITSVTHSVDTVIAYVDTFGGVKAELNDPYININVEILPDKLAIFDYTVRDSLTIISVQKRHSWLFGLIKWTEQKSLRVINNNPNAEIVSLQTIDIIE